MRRAKIIAALDTPGASTGRLIGYARVSTADQSTRMQIDALTKAGVMADNLHEDAVSGSKSKRPGLELALKDCVSGDTLVVWKLDRLGRNALHLFTTIDTLAKRGVGFRSLTEGIDTTTTMGRLVLHIMGALAEFERGLIAERTAKGIRVLAAKGTKFGAKQKIDTDAAEKMFRDGASIKDVCERFKLRSRSTVYSYFTSAEIDELREAGEAARKRAARRKSK